jgi:hypothetical protein
MNTQLLKSKKFRAALGSAVTSLLTFGVAKWGWNLDVQELMLLITIVTAPFLMYIGAEGVSEVSAKKVVEENKVRAELTDKVLAEVAKQIEEKQNETN